MLRPVALRCLSPQSWNSPGIPLCREAMWCGAAPFPARCNGIRWLLRGHFGADSAQDGALSTHRGATPPHWSLFFSASAAARAEIHGALCGHPSARPCIENDAAEIVRCFRRLFSSPAAEDYPVRPAWRRPAIRLSAVPDALRVGEQTQPAFECEGGFWSGNCSDSP
jgi:hypothetical protein